MSFQKLFILLKYHMFWHEYFSILSDVFVKQTNVGQLECCPKVLQKN